MKIRFKCKNFKMRCLSMFLIVCLVLTSFPLTSSAAEAETSCEYAIVVNTDESGKQYATITGYNGNATHLVVPEEINGYQVVEIGSNAFAYSGLEEIVLPEGLKTVGDCAFFSCGNLTGIKLPEGLETIEGSAFAYSGLKGIVLPEGLKTIGGSAFAYSGLEEAVLPEGLKTIVDSAFFRCGNLTEIKLPEGLETIESSAFAYSGLKGIVLPEGLKTVGGSAFAYSGLEEAVLPEGLKTIGDSAFSNCGNLTGIKLPEGLETVGSNVFANSGLKEIVLPEGLKTIGEGMFFYCGSLTGIKLPEGLETIGSDAFAHSGLEEIVLPEGLKTIGHRAFSGCDNLTGIKLPEGLKTIGEGMFFYCGSLTGIKLPEGLETIEGSAFAYSGLKEIVLPEGLKTIGYGAFSGCGNLTGIKLPEGLETIGHYAFANSGLKEIVLPEGLKTIGDSVFSGCGSLTGIVLPEGLKTIGDSAFSNCGNLTGIKLPEGLETIGSNAFVYSGLEEIVLPEGLKTIGDCAFFSCGNLTGIQLPEGLETIENSAFADSGLKEIVLPEGLKTIGAGAFSGCGNLTGIKLPEGLETIGSDAFANSGLKEIVLPEGLKTIGAGAFSGCGNLTGIKLPEGLETIGSNAFAYSGLKEIVLPEGLKTIGEGMFSGCGNLTGIKLPEGLETIGSNAFANSELKEIVLPEGLKTIGDCAFLSCGNLTGIKLPEGLETTGSDAFANSGLKEIVLPEGLKTIGEGMFSGCGSLTGIKLPEGLETIGSFAFANSGLKEIVLPEGLEAIESSAFAGLENLVLIVLPGTYGEDFAIENNIPYQYDINRGAALRVEIQPEDVNADLQGMELVVRSGNYYKSIRLTTSGHYLFSGLSLNQICTVTLVNSYGDVIASVENVNIQENVNSVELKDIIPVTNANMVVKTQDGKDVTQNCSIQWVDEQGSIYASGSSLNHVPVGKSLTCLVKLDSSLGEVYAEPPAQAWIASEQDKNCIVTLEQLSKVLLSGTVTAEGSVPDGVSVSIIQNLNGKNKFNTVAWADSKGRFAVEAYNQPATLVINAKGYKPHTVTLEELTGDCNLGQILLEALAGTKIMVNATYTARAGEGEGTALCSLNALDDISFGIINETTGVTVSDYVQQDTDIVLTDGVSAGDILAITVSSRSDDFEPVECKVEVGNGNVAEMRLEFVQRGSVRVSCRTGKNEEIRLLIYDSNGRLAWTGIYGAEKFLESGGLPDGEYTVVVMGNSRYMAYPSSWKGIQNLGLKKDTDYVSTQVKVQMGKSTYADFEEIPLFSDSNYYVNDPKTTRFSLSRLEATVGKYVLLSAKAPLKEQYEGRIDDVKWVFELPENGGCEIIEGTLSANGISCSDVRYEGQRVIVSSVKPDDLVRMCLLPAESGSHAINAALEYTLDGKTITQPIGNLTLKVEELDFELPEKVMTDKVTASGTAPNASVISVYDNGVLAAKTTANVSGKWSIDFELYKPYTYSEHSIYAEIENNMGKVVRTRTRTLTYQYVEKPVSLKCVTLINASNNVIYFDLSGEKTSGGSYSYNPSYPTFTFVVEMAGEDLSKVKNLRLNVICSDGSTRILHPGFDQKKQNWTISEDFYSNALPEDVSVNFDYDTDTIYSVEEQNEVINKWNETADSILDADLPDDAGIVLDENLEVSEGTRKSCDRYNEALANTRTAYREFCQYFRDVQITDTSSIVKTDNMSLTNTVLSSVPDASQMAEQGYKSIQTTNNDTKVYQKSTESADGSMEQSFIILNGVTGDAGGITATKSDIRVENLNKVETDINAISKKASVVQTSVDELYIAAKEAQGAIKQEIIKDIGDSVGAALLDNTADMLTTKCGLMMAAGVVGKGLAGSFGAGFDLVDSLEGLKKSIELDMMSNAQECKELRNQYIMYSAAKGLMAAGGICGTMFITVGIMTGIIVSAPITIPSIVGSVAFAAVVGGGFSWWKHSLQNRFDRMKRKYGNNADGFYEGTYNGQKATAMIDPSGYVYEAVLSNRLKGVTTACYEKVTKYDIYDEPYEEIQLWDASLYNQQNPLLTNKDGYYAWDVPQGLWQVRYDKEGYESAASEWMDVPPPRFDVNIGMISYEKPDFSGILAYPDEIQLTFNKYMKVDLVTTKSICFLVSGKEITGELKPLNAEKSPEDGTMLATRFHFIPDEALAVGSEVTVKATKTVCTYAGVQPEQDIAAFAKVFLKPETLEATQRLSLEYNGQGSLELKAAPAEAAAGMEVSITNDSAMMLELTENKVILDEQGKAVVHVKALLPGECVINFAMNDSTLTAQSVVTVANLSNIIDSEIETENISNYTAELEYDSCTYNGREKRPGVIVRNGSIELSNGKDYTVSYSNNVNAGNAGVIINGKGNYKGTLKKSFTINKAFRSIKVSNVTKTASSKPMSFYINANYKGGGKITYRSDNKSVTVKANGKVTVAKDFVGKAVIVIKVSASNNYNTASNKITVKVNPAGVKLSEVKNVKGKKVNIKWKKNKKASGYEVQYSTNKKFTGGVKKKNVKKASDTNMTISKLTKGKTYYIRIRTYKTVSGKKFYSDWSVKKKVKIKK